MSAVFLRTVLVPAEIGGLVREDLSGDDCVVFDVLRATSSMVTALAGGARAIYPVATVEEARGLAADLPGAILGGERGGDRIPGFAIGNSPSEYTAFPGKDIISTTTNGTVALVACAGARTLFASCFLNMRATVRAIVSRQPPVIRLVCAGTFDGFAFEDGLAAGCMAGLLEEAVPGLRMCDATCAMRDLWDKNSDRPAERARGVGNGAALVRAGREGDIVWAFREDACPVVAVAGRDPAGRLCLRTGEAWSCS